MLAVVALTVAVAAPWAPDRVLSSPVTPHVAGYELDPSFGNGGITVLPPMWNTVTQIVVLADGSSLLRVDRINELQQFVSTGVAKLRPDGKLDPTFAASSDTPGVVDVGEAWQRLTVMSDGSFFVHLRRYTATGEPDTAFGVNSYIGTEPGVTLSAGLARLVETTDHGIVLIVGDYGLDECYVMSIDTDGMLEMPTFTALPGMCLRAEAVTMPDGRRVVVAQGDTYRLFPLTADGRLDPAFGGGDGVIDTDLLSRFFGMTAAVATSDGKVVVLEIDDFDASLVQRVGLDGNIDTTFGRGGDGLVTVFGLARSMSIDATDALTLEVGQSWDFFSQAALVRLTVDGWVDWRFNERGVLPGWLSVSELGLAAPSHAQAAAGYGALGLLICYMVSSENVPAHTMLALLRPQLSPPPPPPPVPPEPTALLLNSGATVTAYPIRLGVVEHG
jgi:uncharacterized delta-60 repeat protein